MRLAEWRGDLSGKEVIFMKKIDKAAIISGLVLALPLIVAAAPADVVSPILKNVVTALNVVLVIMFALLTIYFIWGVIGYVSAAGDEEKLKAGKQHMLWGIIGMAVVGVAWGVARLVQDYIGATGAKPDIPSF